MDKPRPGEENSWPVVYTNHGMYQYLKEGYYFRIDSLDDIEYDRDEKGKFVKRGTI